MIGEEVEHKKEFTERKGELEKAQYSTTVEDIQSFKVIEKGICPYCHRGYAKGDYITRWSYFIGPKEMRGRGVHIECFRRLEKEYPLERQPQTRRYYVIIDDAGSSYFTSGTMVPLEEFEEEREKVLERGEKPPSIKVRIERPPENGDGKEYEPATIEAEPVPEKYRELIPFVDAPLPLGSDFLTAVIPDEGERKIDAVMKQLKDGVEGIQNSAQFRLFLTTMSKFHDYSVSNLILIAIQKPGATRVAGFQTWKNLGRWVKRGEHGIAILAPVMPPKPKEEEREEEEGIALTPVYFKVVNVFDVGQTEGKPLPEFEVPVLTGEANEALFANVLELAKSQGIEVSFESRPNQDPGIKGMYSGKSIWVRPEESRAQQLKSLIHELAHYYSEGVFRIPRRDAETIAESAAFAVGAHYGFDSGVRSFPYVALWAQDKKVLAQNLSTIRKVADTILRALETAPKKFMSVIDLATVQLYAKTEGDPRGRVTKFCCRYGDWCAPPELLEEGRFLDRIAALRQHYKEKHPGMWGHVEKQPAVEYLPDSAEFLTYTIDNSGQREALDNAFGEAMARCRK